MFAARAAGAGEQPPSEEEMKAAPQKALMPYEKAFKLGTQFKTTCNPDVVESALVTYLSE